MVNIPSRLRRELKACLGPLDESLIVFDALGQRRGLMLDVGAHHGNSLTPFAAAGWHVHAFEPDSANRAYLVRHHGDSPHVVIVPCAVSDEPGKMTLYTSAESTGVSSLVPFTSGHQPAEEVEVITLADYLGQLQAPRVDFLKIDVEGYEQHVLDGYDWAIKPRAIVLEFEDRKTVPLGYNWRDLADRLHGLGYMVMVSEWYPPVRYGVEHRWRRFATYPCDLADSHATGNLIAFQDVSLMRLRAALTISRLRLTVRGPLRLARDRLRQ